MHIPYRCVNVLYLKTVSKVLWYIEVWEWQNKIDLLRHIVHTLFGVAPREIESFCAEAIQRAKLVSHPVDSGCTYTMVKVNGVKVNEVHPWKWNIGDSMNVKCVHGDGRIDSRGMDWKRYSINYCVTSLLHRTPHYAIIHIPSFRPYMSPSFSGHLKVWKALIWFLCMSETLQSSFAADTWQVCWCSEVQWRLCTFLGGNKSSLWVV